MFNSANCLDYGQLDVAYAFLRDEGTESEVGMGVHPATYGTEHYGRYRAALPAITDDIPTDDLFGGVEDRMIAEIDARYADAHEEGVSLREIDELDETMDVSNRETLRERISRREDIILRQHELNLIARGDAYAAKKGGLAQGRATEPTVLNVRITVVEQAEAAPRHIGVRKERDLNASQEDARERKTPRSWKHQEPAAPKQFLRLSAANRVR